MSVDWTKYPPLPKPPKLPEWRDTPEHEAYWEEVEEIRPLCKTNGAVAGCLLFGYYLLQYSTIGCGEITGMIYLRVS